MLLKVIRRLNRYDSEVNCDLQKLEYTVDGAASAPSASLSTPLEWDHVQERLEKFLEKEEAPTSFDHIFGWIDVSILASFRLLWECFVPDGVLKHGELCNHALCCIQQANVGHRVKEPQFIRALMTAICSSAIESKCSCNISFIQIQHNLKLIL